MTSTTTHIALVCPGGPITKDLAQKTGEIAASRYGEKLALHFHPQCFLTSGHFAGSDSERTSAFVEVSNDPTYDAVWFARGGYGAGRIDESAFSSLGDAARHKTYFGYSDAGMLLARLYREGIGRPVHGPMPTDLARKGGDQAICRALDYLATGDVDTIESHAAQGAKATAFNITTLAHLAGSSWMPNLSDHVVMLEDLGEYLYRIDRAMFSIMAEPRIQNAAGIMLGRISDIPENDRPFGQTDEEIFKYWAARAGVPYLGRADIGHDIDNKIVPFGGVASA